MRNTTVGIDIGTYQTKVVVTEIIKDGEKRIPKIIGMGFSESKGLRHGYVVNTKEVAQSIKNAISVAEKSSGIKVHKAYVAIGGIGLQSFTSSGSYMTSRADLEITELDISKAQEICEKEIPTSLIQNRRILHTIPLVYKIDGKVVLAKTPLGMKGNKLEVKMLFVTCLEPHLNDLLQSIDEAEIDVIDVMASPFAASFVTLTKSQKIAGCVLSNIGSETISIVVYENNLPISMEVFPIGSTAITNDIALGLKVSLEEAENIKIGSIGPNSFPKKKLDDIINARLSDMFDLIEGHLKKIGRNGLLPAGIFITGGGSNTHMIEELAKISLKLPSRIASIDVVDPKNKIKDSTWAVAYGLCMLGFSKEGKKEIGVKTTLNQTKEKVFDWLKRFLP